MAKRSMITYKSYSFIDKDPIIDQIRTIVDVESDSYADVHGRSGVSVSTLHNWFKGDTKRPQFATIMAVARSLGYDMNLKKMPRKKNGA